MNMTDNQSFTLIFFTLFCLFFFFFLLLGIITLLEFIGDTLVPVGLCRVVYLNVRRYTSL